MRKIVVVGTSLGGLRALLALLKGLPATFGLPVAIVQHRAAGPDDALVQILQSGCALTVREAEDKDPIRAGTVFLAPADYHLLVEEGHLALSKDELVWYTRPAIDVLFESAAAAYGPGVIAVVLTGANADGTAGAIRIKARGGVVVVQDPATAEAPAMPRAALAAAPDFVVPLPEIAPLLVKLAAAR